MADENAEKVGAVDTTKVQDSIKNLKESLDHNMQNFKKFLELSRQNISILLTKENKYKVIKFDINPDETHKSGSCLYKVIGEFDSWEDACQAHDNKKKWTASIMFNQGLGDQIHDMDEFESASYEQAKQLATQEAEKLYNEDIIEVRVRPAN